MMEHELKQQDLEIDVAFESKALEFGIEMGAAPVMQKNYEKLRNLPSINDVTLIGNKDFEELGLDGITNSELEKMLELE